MAEYNDVYVFDANCGSLLRSIPEYRGLKRKVLRSALAQRTAVDLRNGTWTGVPILVSEKCLRNWICKFGCRDRPSMEKAHVSDTHPEDHAELEQHHGVDLRRNVALGFVDRRAAEKYLRERGVSASESVVRKWYGLYNRWTVEQLWTAIHEDPDDELAWVSRVRTTAADLNKFEVALRVWRDVQGASVADIVERLRRMTYIGEAPSVYKGVDYATVSKFLRTRPPLVSQHGSSSTLTQGQSGTPSSSRPFAG